MYFKENISLKMSQFNCSYLVYAKKMKMNI